MLNTILMVVAVLVIVMGLIAWMATHLEREKRERPYCAKRLLTENERDFWARLRAAYDEDVRGVPSLY